MIYYCEKCENKFDIGRSVSFIKTAMPKCPYCGSGKVGLAKKETLNKNRLDDAMQENLTRG